MSCVVAVTRLAWRPREHTWDEHVEDDRVQQEGALQPRLVPLRVHEGGVHGPVQELLVEQDAVDVLEQDAVDVLRCGTTQKKRLFGPGDESAVLIIVLHTSSVLVTVHQKKKPKLIQPGKSFRLMFGIFPEFWNLLQDPGRFYRNLRSKSKTPVGNHFGPHGTWWARCTSQTSSASAFHR